jgi:hypothetical protein
MRWSECLACGAVALRDLPPPEIVYQGGHATGLGGAWLRHHQALGAFVRAHAVGDVLEIGGGAGALAREAIGQGFSGQWTILEPNPIPAPDLPSQVRYQRALFSPEALNAAPAGAVVMSHVLEHMSDIAGFVADLARAPASLQRVIVAWPVLEQWVEARLAGALNFEHGVFASLDQIVAVFARSGFAPLGRSYFAEMRTEFLAFERTSPRPDIRVPRIAGLAASARAYFQGFVDLAADLVVRLAAHDGPVVIAPASVYTQILLCSGLDAARIDHLWDNAPIKQGQRLFGCELSAAAPDAGVLTGQPLFVVFAGAHTDALQEQFLALAPNGIAIGPNGEQRAGQPQAAPPSLSDAALGRFTLLSGHSGDQVYVVAGDQPVVRKQAGHAARNGRLQQQCARQQAARRLGLRTPAVLATFHAEGCFGFDMEFVASRSLAHIVRNGETFPEVKFFELIAKLGVIGRGERDGVAESHVFTDKLADMAKAIRANPLTQPWRDAIERQIGHLQMRDWSGAPIGWCHGDLTLDNILLNAEGDLVLIDFDAPFVSSPWLDFSKLLQDLDGHWILRDLAATSLQYTSAVARLSDLRAGLAHLLSDSEADFLPRTAQFTALNLLRTLPYATKAATVEFVARRTPLVIGLD